MILWTFAIFEHINIVWLKLINRRARKNINNHIVPLCDVNYFTVNVLSEYNITTTSFSRKKIVFLVDNNITYNRRKLNIILVSSYDHLAK